VGERERERERVTMPMPTKINTPWPSNQGFALPPTA